MAATAWLAVAGEAHAQNECGNAPTGSNSAEIVCDPDSYDPETDGNIYYRLDGSTDYQVKLRNLKGEFGIQINSGDSHVYFPTRPSGVWIEHHGLGTIATVVDGIELTTSEASQRGINLTIYGGTADISRARRNLSLDVRNSQFNTVARAIQGTHTGTGLININAKNLRIKTTGQSGWGISGWHDANGDVSINADGVNIDMAGNSGRGIYGVIHNGIKFNQLTDNAADKTIRLKVTNSNIRGMGTGSIGIGTNHKGSGKMEISVSDSNVNVAGTNSFGINAIHFINGSNAAQSSNQNENMDISINIVDSHITSADSHGIVVQRYNYTAIRPDSTGTSRISIGPNSKISAAGVGILTQVINGATNQLQITGTDIVTIGRNSEVVGNGSLAAIQLGSTNSVITTRGLVSASTNAILNAGQRMKVHILDSGIVKGAISNLAASGMIDIQVGKDMLVVNNVIKKKVGSTGAYDTSVTEATPEQIQSLGGILGKAFYTHRAFAPRAALYEAIPSVLQEMDRQKFIVLTDTADSSELSQDVWIRVGGGLGTYTAKQSTVGAAFRFNRLASEFGTDFPLKSDNLHGSTGLRLTSGRA